jgi:hypothetical protein
MLKVVYLQHKQSTMNRNQVLKESLKVALDNHHSNKI